MAKRRGIYAPLSFFGAPAYNQKSARYVTKIGYNGLTHELKVALL